MAISIRVSGSPANRPAAVLLVSPVRPAAGPWWRAARRLRRNPLAMASALLLALVVAIGFGVPVLIAIDPYQQNLRDSLLPPGSAGHALGTDQFGRDLLLRLVDGARVSLLAGVVAVVIAVAFGGGLG